MFLVRAAFWLSLVVLLLPADPQTGTKAPSVSAIEALSAARATFVDLSAFCGRNAGVCATGSNAFELFSQKVRYGVHMLEDYFQRDNGSADTLKRQDMQVPWHGGKQDRSA